MSSPNLCELSALHPPERLPNGPAGAGGRHFPLRLHLTGIYRQQMMKLEENRKIILNLYFVGENITVMITIKVMLEVDMGDISH